MLKVEFKDPVNGFKNTICRGISVDPMDETIFLIQYKDDAVWQTPLTNIKHISSYEK